ncbi:Ferric reductase, NAD binding domain, partial [Sesbania bispinosa]
VRTHFARPNWKKVFNKMCSKHYSGRIGVFYCGAPVLAKELSKLCFEFNEKVILIVLAFTVYNVKEPEVKMNGVWKHHHHCYYDGKGIGQGTTPPGKAKARRTMRFNVTMEIMAKELLNSPTGSTISEIKLLISAAIPGLMAR